jgi:hypothetical protein
MSFVVSSTLSVSRKEKLDCEELAKYLSKCNISTSISSNISTTPDIEYGCRLEQSISSKQEIRNMWDLIKNKYGFKCAHLKVTGVYDGCIYNYLASNKCPGFQNIE